MATWFQKEIVLSAPSRGFHLVTREVEKQLPELSRVKVGMANLFIKHTSASLSINENCDPDVRTDMEGAFNRIVPESWNKEFFRHTDEGDDDMPGHIKSTLIGASVNIPITNGKFNLGTWQGIYLCEHRNIGGWGSGHQRKVVVTIQGSTA
ncbi:secondary thiamine-phosphate synthase enzyme [Phytophthora nicotianae CJ01A1]|uniref:Secondary thiamine-phosphate synthase enzyme n=4 Tax=Phytophthora nicotianae TaxID=4792 RepID=W2Z8D8_PHYNI|nr:secondary thiamine-phosphate synthase enzyme [Phytophthora nicotianae]ETL38730.1 secondary thiamine-phosphate synthase enzyme [Phytophthora nicotianae]ETL91859.1 secondary thiamine-phosphate synthase enzyme [Phytophthora nicotianae]ETP15157.1 secondary thiamine-phosphate synthase enzyme [Phytophthora nicotianae CJ01A1]ETP43211.1 secondary thiamine-phosphate synthase enzyme [Phytophthora nicotianae P10297]